MTSLTEAHRDLVEVVVEEVGVRVEGHRGGLVAEHPLDGFDVRFGVDCHRYRIIVAEPIRSTAVHDALTHPAERLVGWSVVAISDRVPSEVRSMQSQSVGTGWGLVDVDPA